MKGFTVNTTTTLPLLLIICLSSLTFAANTSRAPDKALSIHSASGCMSCHQGESNQLNHITKKEPNNQQNQHQAKTAANNRRLTS